MEPGAVHYPSPGGVMEEVRTVLVEVEPAFVNEPLENLSGFTASGRVRAIEACQLLRAAQVGGLPDARLEVAVHGLLRRLAEPPGPWIGAEMVLSPGALAVVPAGPEVLSPAPRRRFERAEASESRGFLELRSSTFEELSARGVPLARRVLEHVAPRALSLDTVAVALLARGPAGPCLGIDDDDLPAGQGFTGSSALPLAPAWRLPDGLSRRDELPAWTRRRLDEEYGVLAGEAWDLGGSYAPSPGVTPEMVHPVAVEVVGLREGAPKALRFVGLRDVISAHGELRDGHLRVVAFRAAHALALL
jgi:hypothetical protein